ncbi:MAG: TetR/AcrR family transcriptional regulator [Nocardioides sp.]
MARPREQRVDDAVLAAALDLFFDHGLDRVSIAEVARRAGVSRQSIYRRWDNAADLVQEAVDTVPVELPEPTATTLRDRLVQLLGPVDAPQIAGRMVRAFGQSSPPTETQLRLVETCEKRFIAPRRRQLLGELSAGVARGELSPDLDLALVADALTAPLLFRFLAPGQHVGERSGTPRPERIRAEDLVDLILRGGAPSC